jgi:hypothetical protein
MPLANVGRLVGVLLLVLSRWLATITNFGATLAPPLLDLRTREHVRLLLVALTMIARAFPATQLGWFAISCRM